MVALLWLTQTGSGCAQLLRLAVTRVNASIPGHLEAAELGRLDWSGLRLRGLRVVDPAGQEVARLEQLRIEVDLFALLDGDYVVTEVELVRGEVDLRDLTAERRGLVAAFVDPDAAPVPPRSASPPYVRVDRVHVRDLAVRLPPVEPIRQVDVRRLNFDGSFELAGTPAAMVSGLRAELIRENETLATLDQTEATLARGTESSELFLRLSLPQEAEVELHAQLVIPPEPSWTRQPLSVTLSVRELSSHTLATLFDDPDLDPLFAGRIGAEASATGTLDDAVIQLDLSSAAGPVDLNARVRDCARVEAQVFAPGFELSRLRADLPPRRVGARLALSADTRNPEKIPVELSVREATLDAAPLPAVDAKATVTPDAVEGLDATLRLGRSTVTVDGRAGFDGAADVTVTARIYRDAFAALEQLVGQPIPVDAALSADLEVAIDREQRLDVRGRVAGRHVVAPGVEVDQVDGVVEVTGSPTAPKGTVRLSARGAAVNAQRIDRADVVVTGGPTEYEVELKAGAPEGNVTAELTVARGADRVTLAGHARGKLKGQPWDAEIALTEADFAGYVRTEGIELTIAGQRVAIKGRFSPHGSSVVLDSTPIDLGAFAPWFGLDDPIGGTATIAARFTGTPEVPRLALKVMGKQLTLGNRPALDLQAELRLDTAEGELDGDLQLQATKTDAPPNSVQVRAQLAHRFEGGVGWQQRLNAGQISAEVELGRIDSESVAAWLETELPVSGSVQGRLGASGPLQNPQLVARLEVATSTLSRELAAEIEFDYAGGAAEIAAEVDDEDGRWLDLHAALALEQTDPVTLERFVDQLPTVGDSGRWSVEIRARERELADFAELAELAGRSLPPAAVAATLRLDHEPGTEPQGSLTVRARQTRAHAAYADCEGSGTSLQLQSELSDGQLHAELTAQARGGQLLESRAEAAVALRPMLSGKEPQLGPIRARLHATDLKLELLPFLCSVARGTLSVTAAINDPLGPEPRARAVATARGFSLGAAETVDGRLTTQANRHEIVVRGALDAQGRRSSLDARFPIIWQDGRITVAADAPLSAELVLRDLPLAPFLDPKGALSYVSGTLDGRARAEGSIRAPALDGQIELRDVALTATDLAQPLRDVQGTIRFTDRQILLEDFEAHDQRGVLELTASANLVDTKDIRIEAQIDAERFPLRQLGQVVATADIEAAVETTITPDHTQVEITLGAVDLWIENAKLRRGIAFEHHPDFVVDGVQVSSQTEPTSATGTAAVAVGNGESDTPPEAPVTTTVLLRADEGVWIKRSDLAAKLSADLDAEIAGEQVRIKGRVAVDRGYLQLLGKVFDIERDGYLEFTGAATPDPVVAITAVHQNRRSGQDVTVTITGRGSAPELEFRLDDERVTAGQAFQAIYGAQHANEDPGDASAQARAFVGGLTAGLLATTARKEFGWAAPILMIEPGERTSEGRVRAGLEFDQLVPQFLRNVVTGVYFEGILANESQGSERTVERSDARVEAGALLELYFPDRFFAAGEYGPGATWSLDVGWQL